FTLHHAKHLVHNAIKIHFVLRDKDRAMHVSARRIDDKGELNKASFTSSNFVFLIIASILFILLRILLIAYTCITYFTIFN
ncbi:MAG: hypothetical protein IIU03_12015, partial [Bacteroidales bacterium]|nr:hypothetical protein [Bacteroidales bacterium]